MISPTIGRVVWFYKYIPNQGHKGPMAAHVAYVWSDIMVNLMVINEDGTTRSSTSTRLRQDNAPIPESDYCEWMPYQKGQAAKTEALEAKLIAQEE
jgi:hypothetical protein